jgi:magnesium chelatase family protein
MNPCPCGYLGHPNGKCRCTPDQVVRYRAKLSGPLLDRIDLQIEVPALSETEMTAISEGESSRAVQQRVEAARNRQLARQGKRNADLRPSEIDRYCAPDSAGKLLLQQAIARLQLSARAYHRILKIARSIADLAGSLTVSAANVAEAIQYRRLSKG